MATHDYIISNQTFPSTRSDINAVLSAIVSNNSSATEPSTTYAYMWWYDTTTTTLKFRNRDNDAWVGFASFDMDNDTVNFLDSTVTITGLATTATGTVFTLSDTDNKSSVDFIIDNEKKLVLREASGNGTNYVALKAPASLASDVTFTLPSADGTADQVLKTDGSGNLSFTDVSGGISWQSSIVTGSTLTAVAGNGYWIDTTSNTCTITLPASANVGDQIIFSDYARTWGTNKIIIDSNGLNYQGDPDTYTVEYNTNGQTVNIVYSGATKGWIPISDDDVTDVPIASPYSVDFLVIAGGGGGGNGVDSVIVGGGGGAGGYRNSYSTETSGGGGSSESSLSFSPGTTYTITVGAGGSNDTNGNDSSISGADITTITSVGGGSGAGQSSGDTAGNGGSGGGSGGGGGNTGNNGTGTANQGFNGGNSSDSAAADYHGGGGGGAGEAGNTDDNASGGDGLSSSITGSAVTRGGGGGGAVAETDQGYSCAGGDGGGGNGSQNNGSVTNGSANTGGGGGGNYQGGTNETGASGGSGVVILRMPDANYSSTTTGNPTVNNNVGGSGETVLIFNASGSYTA